MIRVYALLLMLSGCSSITGAWTGNIGPFKSTLKFNDDGTGLICSTRKGKNTLEKIDYDGEFITTIRGTKIEVLSVSGDSLLIEDGRPIAKRYELTRNDNLTGVNWYCRSKLK